MWFSARAHLGNSGVFCCSWILATGVIVLQFTFHLMVTVTGFPDTRAHCVQRAARENGGKGSVVLPSVPFPSAVLTPALERKNKPSAQQLLPPPTKPSLRPLQKSQQCLFGAGDGSVRMSECPVLSIHQTLPRSCLDKH